MKKLFPIMLLVLSLSLVAVAVAAANGDPVGGCPDGFQLHEAMQHDDHHGHHHVGTDTDRNGDGWICEKHVSVNGNIHVHIDNKVPLP